MAGQEHKLYNIHFAASPSVDIVFRNGSWNDLPISCAEWERIKHQGANQLAELWDV